MRLTKWQHIVCLLLLARLMGQYCFARWCLSPSVVVFNAATGRAGRPTLHGGPVVLRPVRATPCFNSIIVHYDFCRALITEVPWIVVVVPVSPRSIKASHIYFTHCYSASEAARCQHSTLNGTDGTSTLLLLLLLRPVHIAAQNRTEATATATV